MGKEREEVIKEEELSPAMVEAKPLYVEQLGFTKEDIETFMMWSMGKEAEPPQVVRKMMNNLSQKLTVSLGLNITSNQRRQQNLMLRIQQMEDKLLSDDEWDALEFDQKLKLYQEIRKTNEGLMETQRKFIAQNKELLPSEGSDQSKLMAMIMTLSPDKLQKVLEFLNEGDTGNTGEPEDILE